MKGKHEALIPPAGPGLAEAHPGVISTAALGIVQYVKGTKVHYKLPAALLFIPAAVRLFFSTLTIAALNSRQPHLFRQLLGMDLQVLHASG